MPNYIKFFLPVTFLIGVVIYYTSGHPIFALFRALSYLFLIYWYWDNFKDKYRFSSVFVYIHLTIAFLIPIVHWITGQKIGLNADLLVNLVASLCFLVVFGENIVLKRYNLEKNTWRKIVLPYFIVPIAFLSFAILPNLNQFYTTIVIIYAIILILTGIASVYYSNHEIVKLYVSWGMFLVLLAHGMNAIQLLSYQFAAAYFIVFSLTVFAKVLIIYGLIKEKELNLQKQMA
jgi:hypothetical protein